MSIVPSTTEPPSTYPSRRIARYNHAITDHQRLLSSTSSSSAAMDAAQITYTSCDVRQTYNGPRTSIRQHTVREKTARSREAREISIVEPSRRFVTLAFTRVIVPSACTLLKRTTGRKKNSPRKTWRTVRFSFRLCRYRRRSSRAIVRDAIVRPTDRYTRRGT